MLWLLITVISLLFPRSVQAQSSLFFQILETYHPSSFYQVDFQPTPIPTPIPTTIPSVLGVTTQNSTLPHIGGGNSREITVALLGDSMIDTLRPYLSTLQQYLTNYYPHHTFRILDYGVGASNIESGLKRLTQDYEYQGESYDSLLSLTPDIIVVESFAYNNFGNTQSGINRHWQALSSIVATIQKKSPSTKIILAATIAPNSTNFAKGAPNIHLTALEKRENATTIKTYLQNLVNFATSQNYPLADAYHPSTNFINEGDTAYIDPKDNIHPSVTGAKLFFSILAKSITDNRLID